MHAALTPESSRAASPVAQADPAESGVFALRDGRDAFAARALLADGAEKSIDAQYYIWRLDVTGTLLLKALHRAADRGVRVRLLLDDNDTAGMDSALCALDSHPNIEVRLFNSFPHRRLRYLDYLLDFSRLNRRMHNKSFTVDNRATIVGGRNVGDEYFGTGDNPLFIDLDVLAIGAVVDDVARDFERYWTSSSAHPAARVLKGGPALQPSGDPSQDAAASEYLEALANSAFAQDMRADRLSFEWIPVRMVSDDPSKGLGKAAEHQLLWARLKQVARGPTQEMQLVSAYFVPGPKGVEFLSAHARAGESMTVVTNSLEATDVAAVYAGYAKRRRSLLEAGVRLYEMKRGFAAPSVHRHAGSRASSTASLHAKTFQVDRKRVFVGSFNFDPRSQRLNTEMGLVIESPRMAHSVANNIQKLALGRCYEVRLGSRGALQWLEKAGDKDVVHDHEPGAGFWRRWAVKALSLLPIEWLL